MRTLYVLTAVLTAFGCLAPAQATEVPSTDAATYCKTAGDIDARRGGARLDGAGALHAARDQGED
jgi:hypothetical protein